MKFTMYLPPPPPPIGLPGITGGNPLSAYSYQFYLISMIHIRIFFHVRYFFKFIHKESV
jgi:hypothetical protein